MKPRTRCCEWSLVINVAVILFLSAVEVWLTYRRLLVSGIESSISVINREICRKLEAEGGRGIYIVGEKSNKMFEYFVERSNTCADLYLIGNGSVIPIHMEDIPRLHKGPYYFLTRVNLPVHRMFLRHGLKCHIDTGEISTHLTRAEVEAMSEITRQCVGFLGAMGSYEVVAEGLGIRISRGRPGEIHVRYRQMPSVIKSVFGNRCEFLEDLKVHFVGFMKTINPGMATCNFCDSYVKSVLRLLHDADILKRIPPIEKYPELVHCLFPFAITTRSYHIRKEELIVGGVVLDRAIANEYLKPLFNTENVDKKTRHGGRFIFTSHVSFRDDEDRYTVDFL